MDISIVIPVFNEAIFLEKSLTSLLSQTYLPKEVVVVDDGSTDTSVIIAQKMAQQHSCLRVITSETSSSHAPGQKVVRAFERGFAALTTDWDIICKFDADIDFPLHYLETLKNAFSNNSSLGMFSGLLTIKKDNAWVLESISNSYHVRGPIKAYSKTCFKAIGGLRPVLGWDTLDELLTLHNGFKVQTDSTLLAKHLRPTGSEYSIKAEKAKGALFYQLGYGLVLGFLASLKWSLQQKGSFLGVLGGFLSAWISKKPKMVSRDEARFIRKYRWSAILRRLVP